MTNVVAFYGNAASCTKYSLDPIDWTAAQRAPDSNLWSLSAQSGTIIDKANPPPIVWRLDLAVYPPGYNAFGWLGSRGY